MEKVISNIIDKLTKDDKYRIKENKKNSLIDFLGLFPEKNTMVTNTRNIFWQLVW